MLLDDGLAAVVEKHWQEVRMHADRMPLAVNWAKYRDLERLGILKVMAARQDDRLVGYASFMVMPHLHYAETIHAMNDAIYVDTEVRGVGIGLIRACEKALAELGEGQWVRILYHAKIHVEQERGGFGRVFNALGYQAFETTHDKLVRV